MEPAMTHLGGTAAASALSLYLLWRAACTLPADQAAALGHARLRGPAIARHGAEHDHLVEPGFRGSSPGSGGRRAPRRGPYPHLQRTARGAGPDRGRAREGPVSPLAG